jgi:hypothetical protein
MKIGDKVVFMQEPHGGERGPGAIGGKRHGAILTISEIVTSGHYDWCSKQNPCYHVEENGYHYQKHCFVARKCKLKITHINL